jgi:hypothetical protein
VTLECLAGSTLLAELTVRGHDPIPADPPETEHIIPGHRAVGGVVILRIGADGTEGGGDLFGKCAIYLGNKQPGEKAAGRNGQRSDVARLGTVGERRDADQSTLRFVADRFR